MRLNFGHWTAVTLLAAAGAANAAEGGKPPGQMSVENIQACMSKNLVNRGALRELNVTATDDEGRNHALRMHLYWKPTKDGHTRMNLRIVEPAAMVGSSYLLLEQGQQEEVYFFLRGTDQAVRITGQNMGEPLWGTDFSYGEIKQVLGLLYIGDTRRIADTKVGDRTAYTMETRSKFHEVGGYVKVVSYVDQASCTLLKTEFFQKADRVRKVLEADASKLLKADTYWLMLGYTMTDKREKTHTTVDLSDFSLMERLPEKLFDPKTFFEPFD
jgi:hypothetical protein